MTTETFAGSKNLQWHKVDFNQFMRLRNHLVIAAEDFDREENLSSVLIPTLSKDIDEQLKLGHKVVDVVDRPYGKICNSAAVQCEQVREFKCSSPIVCKEEGGREVSTNCLCEI